MEMADSRWDRLAPLTGVAFVVLTVIGIVVGSSGSPSDFPAQAVDAAEYYQDETDAIIISSWIGAVGAFFLFWFAGVVRARLRAANERLATTAFGGAVAAATAVLLMNAVNAVGALRADEYKRIDPAIAAIYNDLQGILIGVVLAVSLAVWIAATGVLALRTGALPRALGIVSLVIAVGLLIFPIAWAVTALGVLWALVLSILLYLRPAAEEPASAPPASAPPA